MDKTKLRILYLINNFSKGGAERFLVDLCTELKNNNNIDFIVGTLNNDNQYPDLTDKFEIINLNYSPFSITGKNENKKYSDLLKSFKPNIIHTNLFLSEFLTSYYPDNNITYVCHGHDNMHQFQNLTISSFFNKKKLLEFYEKHYLIKKKYKITNTYFIANSSHTSEFYKKSLPVKMKNKVRLIPYGFDYNRFYLQEDRKIDRNSTFKILNVGSFQDKKNQIFIVDIAKELKKLNIQFEINLLGSGQNYEKVRNAVRDNGLNDYIKLRGIINNVEDWYRSSDLYLHTAWYEPFGLVFLEAMAAGLPVITLDGKGNRDIIENGKNGYIFYNQDAAHFVEAIADLLTDHNKYQRISSYAKEYAEKFDIKYKVQELVDFYYSILTRND